MIRRLRGLLAAQAAIEKLGTDEYYLSNVAVYPEYRGRGVGATLIAAAEGQAANAGCSAIVLDVETDNAGAIRLYRKLGFSERWKTAPLLLDGAEFSFFRMEKPVQ
jgi:ribosomal protein S18 acetylase RimI-like enzyme